MSRYNPNRLIDKNGEFSWDKLTEEFKINAKRIMLGEDPVYKEALNATKNSMTQGYIQTKNTITENVLTQLGYDIVEVMQTKARCVTHNIQWFSRAWEKENIEYLQVDDKIVGEVRLVVDGMSLRWEGRVYGDS